MKTIDTIDTSPFKKLVMTIGELPTTFIESMSYYEALAWLVDYIKNTVIPAVNNNAEATEELQKLFVELKEFVDNYFDNLDVQEEINNKLDAMAESGQLAEIINQEIFGELNDKIDSLQQEFDSSILSIPFNHIFVGTFFDSDNQKVHFLTSQDGQHWAEINKSISITGRDPNIIYNENNKTFYLSLTQSSGVNYDFICYTSTDFVTWTPHQVDLGLHTGNRWAPELFVDTDGTMIATISAGTPTDMKIYLSECTDLDTLTFSNARQLSLGLTNVIDANITKYNGTYYLTVKNEDTAKIIIYTSADLITFTAVNSDVIGSNIPCEGGQLININDRWFFYGDTWQSYGNYGLKQTDDITNFGFLITNDSLRSMRHGSVCYLNDYEAVHIVTTVPDYTNALITRKTESQIQLSGTYADLTVYPNFFYRVNADTIITNLHNPYDLQLMPFAFTGGRGISLTITNMPNGGHATKIYNSRGENEKLQFVSLQGDGYATGRRIEEISASDLLTLNDDTQWSVSVYSPKRIDNRVFFQLSVTKLVSSASVGPFNINTAYRPVGVVPIPNDRGIGSIFIRENGGIGGSNNFVQNQSTYCYCAYDIY